MKCLLIRSPYNHDDSVNEDHSADNIDSLQTKELFPTHQDRGDDEDIANVVAYVIGRIAAKRGNPCVYLANIEDLIS